MDATNIFLQSLAMPEYSRIEYFKKQQIESGYSAEIFFKFMMDVHQHYVFEIKSRIADFGHHQKDLGLPLLLETQFRIPGHITLNTLENLKKNIEAANNPKPAKHVKAFNEYFVPSYAETLPQALKSAFAGDNKTTLAVLIHVLRFECEPRLLIVENGDFKAFHEAMKQYFSGQDIGKREYYVTTLKALEGNKTRQPEIKNSKDRIKAILQSIDNK